MGLAIGWFAVGLFVIFCVYLYGQVHAAVNRKPKPPEPTPQVREVFVPRPPEPKKPEPPPKPSKEELLRRADERMYQDSEIIKASQMSEEAKTEALQNLRDRYEQRVFGILDGSIRE